MSRWAFALALGSVAACGRAKDPPPSATAIAAPLTSASASAPARDLDPPKVVPLASAFSAADAAVLEASVPTAIALPRVTVTNIGMHVGGGPYDEATKEPITLSVVPHFDALKQCYAKVKPQVAGDIGVDLFLQAKGGRAKVSHPRTGLKGEGFEACVIGVFEQIEFQKLKTNTTTVSYSLRFVPL